MTIHHVALECRESEADAEVAFWELLGFREVPLSSASLKGRARWVQGQGTQVHVLFVEEPVVPQRGHVAIVTPDHKAALRQLRKHGFTVDVREPHWDSPRAQVRSPAGHLVELMAFPPA